MAISDVMSAPNAAPSAHFSQHTSIFSIKAFQHLPLMDSSYSDSRKKKKTGEEKKMYRLSNNFKYTLYLWLTCGRDT